MKKLFFLILIILLFPSTAYALDISAEYACVMIKDTREVVFEKNAYSEYPMASTTKIMTALVALEQGFSDDTVTVSRNAAEQEGSSIYLRAGDKIAMSDLLCGLMLSSGNDAAAAVAEHIAGDTDTFAEMMNETAVEIGALHTHFKNPSGLDADGHYTTAYDLALITEYALHNETFCEIVGSVTKSAALKNSGAVLYFSNHNKLLKSYPGAIGVKTGYTKSTGRCLASAAERDGITVIAVTLNAPDDWNDHTRLLDLAFDTYEKKQIIRSGETMKELWADGCLLRALAAEEVCIPAKRAGSADCEIILHTPAAPHAKITAGEKIGYAEIIVNGVKYTQIDLTADTDVLAEEKRRGNIGTIFMRIINSWL